MRLFLLFVTLFLSVPALAETGFSRFQKDLAVANDHIKSAANYLRTGNLVFADIELESANQKWGEMTAAHGQEAVPPYDTQDLRSSLQVIGAVLSESRVSVQEQDYEVARTRLLSVRHLLNELNMRNNVKTTADRILASSAIMERIWTFRHAPPDWDDPESVSRLGLLTHNYQAALSEVDQNVSPDIKNNAEFRRLIDGMQRSLELAHKAIDDHDSQLLINVLRELRSFDRILFLRFG